MQTDPDSLVANRALRYGHPYDNFYRIALIWESITGRKYTRHEVGLMLAGTKIARQVPGYDEDSCDDLGGYGRAIEAVHLREVDPDAWEAAVPHGW